MISLIKSSTTDPWCLTDKLVMLFMWCSAIGFNVNLIIDWF
jgi:hypothetical protein